MPTLKLLAVAALSLALTSTSQAHHRRHYRSHKIERLAVLQPQTTSDTDKSDPRYGSPVLPMGRGHLKQERPIAARGRDLADGGADPRPSLWCAWWLRRKLGIPKSAFPPYGYNLARNFAYIGSPAPHGCTGCIAVFSRGRGGHVGLVESWDSDGDPVILSGNVNGRVETAPHPARRLIALRWAT